MREDVEAYVQACLVCQQDKVEAKAEASTGLLEPLPIMEQPLESVSMDFITSLPKSKGYEPIMVVIDRLPKYVTFIPTVCPTEEEAQQFMNRIVKYCGLPSSIISDRDPRFTGKFWSKMLKLLWSDLNMSMSLHP